jgi:hypothetical protein
MKVLITKNKETFQFLVKDLFPTIERHDCRDTKEGSFVAFLNVTFVRRDCGILGYKRHIHAASGVQATNATLLKPTLRHF